MTGPDPDWAIKRQLEARLPACAFRCQPLKALLVIPFFAALGGGSLYLVIAPLPWYASVLVAVGLGLAYASFLFFGHEIAHGAIVRSRRLQLALLYAPFLIACLSPRLWYAWHNRAHHAFTNIDKADPDCWGQVSAYRPARVRNLLYRLTPGSRHWLSAFYFPFWFTVHTQLTLYGGSWMRSFGGLPRRGAMIEASLMYGFWLAIAISVGERALYVVLIPMIVMNAVVMSYIATNHQLRPKYPADARPASLATSMSVTTFRWLDRIHFHFSHHVEHHLFPTMAARHLPLVRRALREIAPADYLAPPQWLALLMLFRTPRMTDGSDMFADPLTGRRLPVRDVELRLRAAPRR